MSTSSPSVQTPLSQPVSSVKPKAVASADKHIWGIFIALCIISVIELYSASSREVSSSSIGVMGPLLRHFAMLSVGIGLTWFFSRRHYSFFALFTIVFSVISVAAMIYVMFFGQYINGARRSMSLLGFGIYPAEMIKISAVLLVVLVMSLNQDRKGVGITRKGMIICAAILGFFCLLLVKQGLTNTLLLFAITFSMMIIGGVKLSHLIYMIGAFVIAAAVFVGFLFLTEKSSEIPADATQQTELVGENGKGEGSRLSTWIARLSRHSSDSVPKWEIEPRGVNRQEILSYMAQAHGGVYGVGPGNSREASRLPLAFSDYIYAIVVEELGLAGGILVLVLYLWLLGRAAGIASRCKITYPALIVMGMAVMIAFQALFHMGIVTGVFPVSGQPLPLISKGGTSIIVTCLAFGIMLSVSRTATRSGNRTSETREEQEALPEQLRDENRMQL